MSEYIELGFAKLDIERVKRRSYCEAVFCESKSDEQLVKIFQAFCDTGANVIGTRCCDKQYQILKKHFGSLLTYDKLAKVVTLVQREVEKIGEVAICTGGTGDISVALEAALCAEFYGSNVKKYYDIGVAGIHRLFDKIDEIKKSKCSCSCCRHGRSIGFNYCRLG